MALLSMVSVHVTNLRLTTYIGRVLHSARWIDGAFYFVALSGFVTGLVHRRIRLQRGRRASARKVLRRCGQIYIVHVLLTLVAVTITTIAGHSVTHQFTPTWARIGGPLVGTVGVIFLRVASSDNNILPLYVIFLLLAIPVMSLLEAGLWGVVAGLSMAVYALGRLVGGLALVAGSFQLTSWQSLFFCGLMAGWMWEHERHRIPHGWRRLVVALCATTAAALYLTALLAPERGVALFGRALAKSGGGPVALLFAVVAIVSSYVLLRRVRAFRLGQLALQPLALLGAKGLPGYATMVVAVSLLDLMPSVPRNDAVVLVVATACALAEGGALLLDRRRRLRSAEPQRSVVGTASDARPIAGAIVP